MSTRVLVVDDEKLIRWSVCEKLRAAGHECYAAETGEEAREAARQGLFDLAVLDMKLPDTEGTQLLEDLRSLQPGMACIMMTAYSTVDNAVAAMKLGAADYLTKPFSMEVLVETVARVLAAPGAAGSGAAGAETERRRFGLDSIIGQSPAMVRCKEVARRLARSDAASVLLLGETGTGKDMFARALHYESPRVERPFMNITCTAMPETLFDSELFGYEEGAFTDARQQKKGLFELSDGGTIFLDEAGDMPAALQGKLLRVLEEKAFRRIGGHEDIQVDVRVIAATNRDLGQALADGSFRQDLYYRLSAVPLELPPLRDRPEDLPVLAAHFLEMANRTYQRHCEGFSDDSLDHLRAYAWPGNVRELRNVIERAVLLAGDGPLRPVDLPLAASGLGMREGRDAGFLLPPGGCDLEVVERELIGQALARTAGNQSAAARLVGLTRDQIRYKVEKHGLGDAGRSAG